MTWLLARVTADATNDPLWHGVDIKAPTAPPIEEFFSVGTGSGATILEGQFSVVIAWFDDDLVPVVGVGTGTAELVRLDSLPIFEDQQPQRHMSLRAPIVNDAVWRPHNIPGTHGLWTVRMSAMTPPVGGTRAAVFYWA